jgi:hypothetical protein
MRSILTVTSPAGDRTLLTIAEMREAAGVTVNTYDTQLQSIEKRITAAITTECNIAIGSGAPPTLRQETLTETFYQIYGEELVLSRRHEISVSSLVEDGVTLTDADIIVDPETGIMNKICNDYPTWWSARKIVVVYNAGFATVPDDLKMAAIEFMRTTWLGASRDPLVKSQRVRVYDVDETETQYWVGSVPGQSSESAVPDIVAGQLTRFRIAAVG